jgi:hypothetical protein
VTARVIIKSIFCPQRLIRGPRKSCITFHHYIYMFMFPKIIIISGIFLYNDRRGLTGKVHTCQEGGVTFFAVQGAKSGSSMINQEKGNSPFYHNPCLYALPSLHLQLSLQKLGESYQWLTPWLYIYIYILPTCIKLNTWVIQSSTCMIYLGCNTDHLSNTKQVFKK